MIPGRRRREPRSLCRGLSTGPWPSLLFFSSALDRQPFGCILKCMDLVFRALADESRRALLDSLSARSAQTLSELCSGLNEKGVAMTRQAVSKHLAILEEAN